MQTILYLEPWLDSYNYEVDSAVDRDSARGFKSQSARSHRNIKTVSVTRRLRLSQLPYFEYFVRVLLNNGNDRFIDYYADSSGLQHGVVRIVGGSYSVKTDTLTHVVTCDLEVIGG